MTRQDIEATLDQVLAGTQTLYNIDFVTVKTSLNRLLEKAHEGAQKEYLKVIHQPEHQRDDELRDQYHGTIYPHTLSGWGKKLPKTASKPFLNALGAFWDVYVQFTPVCEKFVKAKALVVKARKPSDRPRSTPERTIDNTGTCSCCGQNVKLEGGKIVQHGYTIRHGYQEGRCAGVGQLPIEVSPAGAERYLKALQSIQSDRQTQLVEANRAGEKKRIWSIESDLRALANDIRHFSKVVKDWAPKALPDGRRDHLQKKG